MGMEKMFERLRKLFDRNKGAKPVKSDFMRPKEEPVKKPSVVSSDRKGPLPAVIQDKPPAILLPSVTIAPAPVSKPEEEVKPAAPPLPPDIDPSQVVIVRHDAKKASGERFRYVDKPLKPLGGEERRPDVIKYSDKKGGEAFKYTATPVVPRSSVESHEKPAEVFKYKPVRVEIKS
jgi:hypothetical protein